MKLSYRITFISLLLLVLIFFSIYYQNNYIQHREYPDDEAIISSPSGYINTTISIYGKVTSQSTDNFSLLVRHEGKSMVFNISSSADPRPGDNVEVLGMLHRDKHVQAEKIIVLRKWKLEFLYLRSAFAFIGPLFVFRKEWSFDFKNMRFY